MGDIEEIGYPKLYEEMMMTLTGNNFIDLLYLSEADKRIVAMREVLRAPKPLVDKDFKQYGGNSMEIEAFGIELFFKDACIYNGNDSGVYGKGDIVFSGITFAYNSKIVPPFNLHLGESYDIVLQKLGREQDYSTRRFPQKIWKFTRDDKKDYLLYAFFEDDYSKLLHLRLSAYTSAVEG